MRARIDDIEIDYRVEGSGRLVALGHSLGMAGDLFDSLRPSLEEQGRVLTWDARGHGGSLKPASGFCIEDLASDLDGILDLLGAESAVVGGVSMGGCIAMAYALARPEKVEGLILMDTTAGYGEEMRPAWEQRAIDVEARGMEPVAAVNLPRWFSDDFLESDAAREVRDRLLSNDAASYAAACRALGAFDVRDRLVEIRCPTLILVGAEDPATPVAMSREIHERIRDSELHLLDGLRHLAPVEAPERIGRLVASFLQGL
jgi:3-oxoadipate enol-lactonase